MTHLIRKRISTTENKKPVRKESPYWYIRYRDVGGIWRERRAYKDKTASSQKMAEIVRRVELQDAGVNSCIDRVHALG